MTMKPSNHSAAGERVGGSINVHGCTTRHAGQIKFLGGLVK